MGDITKISESVYWVGVKDWDRRMFDALIPLPQGTSYNSYLVQGNEKTALIDTVNPGFEEQLRQNINRYSKVDSLDYVIMNHAEPDHAFTIQSIMNSVPKATLITSEKGAKMAMVQYDVPEERIKIVQDGDTLDLGGKTLKFIAAPWLHWPETMFTYLVEEKTLFTCDFFGSHTAAGFYSDEVEDLIPMAKRYFGEIMMPFRKLGAKALSKIEDLDIEIIAPSHGPIHRNPELILEAYKKWTAGETLEKVIVVYVSMWNSTRKMVDRMVQELVRAGMDVKVFNLENSDIGDIARELVDSRAIVLGTPTVLGGMHPLAVYGTYLVKALKPPAKYAVALSSYGWGGGSIKQAQEMLSGTKIEILGAIDVNGPPTDKDYQDIEKLSAELVGKIRENP
ncbi:flavorubredoxin [Methanohalophilus levihalophilus]|uniref:FprA family A-type flavoprotein n=1 Tax=Methanohalophilus levihalophilus TaxID=1431282 RepID=UPI001AE870A2|nr:FprA family A-type flavoprotein [Methanohalophilus levihalophilus]MBP2029510.1 flavorubredoxin [Methanohalophilus levihalophilus]